ncbi:MAG: FAD-dependent oxidoreductase [Chloroflexi bacterium AL-W]|nr:FAD-dependent oxidoreductase [Chloroflexi bacterium AL-N1]NOK68124.1 FAD-dependent oxidoreductase [Chloroflexi bacterium AL-N10]NOK73464.1 FAD-dependent oxidoreductase [Chloroflexi bacterium AL-N5]NOK83378.1 FAD-dependent oxidoreductase [Chloroflexi bacterium AL-W]NOK87795.1 FAD-dependent oxidoreductase [Chloroflexi bacterium AL-N15]
MPSKLAFDAIVVGGGPAGTSAALTMARSGLKVVLIERGRFVGSKNFFGGVMYTHALADVLPDYWERKPPFERPVTEQGYWMLSPDSVVRVMHKSEEYNQEPADSYTVLRAQFDLWFAEQAAKAGALVITKTTVTDILRDPQGRVIGVNTDRPDGEVYAPIVVISEGVNNLLTQKLGLINNDLPPRFVALAVKEYISLPTKDIQSRFGLSGAKEGVAIDIFGDATLGLPGTSFLYTDKAGVSIGVGMLLEEFVQHKVRPYEVLARFKNHPVIRPYLEGGESREYGAHLIPETGYDRMPKLNADGVLVAGDAAGMVDALHREGTNLAMTAGRMAGETAIAAHLRRDFSAGFLNQYRQNLEASFVLKDMKQYRRMTDFLDSTPHFLGTYANFLNEAALRYFTAHGMPKRTMEKEIFGMLQERRSFFGMAWDMLKLLRAMRG